MLKPQTTERLDDYWAADFGCSLDEYLREYHVQKHAGELEREGNGGIYCFIRPHQTTISIPAEWFDSIHSLLPASPNELANTLRSTAAAIVGPAYIGYSECAPISASGARAVDEQDHVAWSDLRSACLPLEWDHGGSDLSDTCSGVFSGDRLISLAGYKSWGGVIAHISVVTHPGFRGQGHAHKAVGHLMKQAIDDGLIPQYQTLDSNSASIQVASALGFSRYATSMSIKLPSLVEDIAKLDEVTMAPILRESGAIYSLERRSSGLAREIENGSVVVTHYCEQDLVAYVQYMPRDNDEYYIVSIQVHPDYRNGFALKKLLGNLACSLLARNPESITSSVHSNNEQSIHLHQRLGFAEKERVNNKVKFVFSGETMIEKLSKLSLLKSERNKNC